MPDIFIHGCLSAIGERYTPEVGVSPGKRLMADSNEHALTIISFPIQKCS